MERYFIYLAFDGSSFHGWQRQPNAVSVQEVLEQGLSRLMGHTVELTGAGRTDAGVHAGLMVAHFDSAVPVDTGGLTHRLRRMLPRDIFVYAVVPVRSDAHARFDAVARTYHYYLRTEDSPFSRSYSYRPLYPVSFERMNKAASCLLKHTDFTSFSKVNTDVKTFNCRIDCARWRPLSPTLWQFEITADRFLRNMVRAVVGTMLDIGRREGDEVEAMERVLNRKDRSAAGESVPGNALFLSDIVYPDTLFLEGKSPEIAKKEAYLFF